MAGKESFLVTRFQYGISKVSIIPDSCLGILLFSAEIEMRSAVVLWLPKAWWPSRMILAVKYRSEVLVRYSYCFGTLSAGSLPPSEVAS